jgi:hypothetical protein
MARHDPSNAGQNQFTKGDEVKCVVTDIGYGEKDPKKQDGRIKVCTLEQLKTPNITDDKLPWVKVRQDASSAGLGTVGSFPGHSLVVGSIVTAKYIDNNGNMEVVSCEGTTEEPNEKDGRHPSSKDSSFFPVVNALTGAKGLDHIMKQVFGGRNPYDLKGIPDALRVLEGKFNLVVNQFRGKDPLKEIAKFANLPSGKKGFKSVKDAKTPESIGNFLANAGSVLNTPKFIEKTIGQKGELIPGALKMAQNLQKSVSGGGISNVFTSVGGVGNLAGAIAGIGAISKTAADNKPNDEEMNELEEELRRLYKLLTGQEPLDVNGQETNEYKAWKQLYLSGNYIVEEIV